MELISVIFPIIRFN